MADDFTPDTTETTTAAATAPEETAPAAPAKKAAAKKTAAKKAPAKKAAAKKTATKKAAAKKTAAAPADEPLIDVPVAAPAEAAPAADAAETAEPAAAPAKKVAKKAATKKTAAKKTAAKKTTAKRATKKAAAAEVEPEAVVEAPAPAETDEQSAASVPAALFQAPEPVKATRRRTRKAAAPVEPAPVEEPAEDEVVETAAETAVESPAEVDETTEATEIPEDAADEADAVEAEADADADHGDEDDDEDGSTPARRRRRRGGRRRRKSGSNGANGDAADGTHADAEDGTETDGDAESSEAAEAAEEGEGGTSRRRRRRRRAGESGAEDDAEPGVNTVVKVRESRPLEQQITAVSGSTRLEAKKQRRREGREAGRRRAPIVSEAEFLARRESVERVMVVRQREDLTQIGVIEDKVLVEHYVARESQTSLIGNIYLGRVQNVLPSMEAAFVDIGKGRNAVLYAGEVNWSALGHKDGQPRKIESVLSSGQTVLVQVTKDPVGHKGARLTSQISLAGRFLVYVPDGTTSGISRKLPDTERARLKSVLKEIVPESAGVIVRTAAEGASEEELTRDVERLKARWEDIEAKAASKGNAQLLYGEPDLTLKVVRDLFTEDFAKLVVQGDEAWETVRNYVEHVAPDLAERLEKHEPGDGTPDLFSVYRVDEQISKGLDRKVWLPSGGSLVIDRTEAMTVVDVNTGKFTGSGGNLEETVTKNNLEAAEEIVRQLRLRDIGGIIVVDFIDMVLESNRDLVLRRLVECLGRDRTRHQVAEVTSLGLVQMTRKRIGTGLVEAFSENCTHCQGRGIVVHEHPVATSGAPQVDPDEAPRSRRRRGGRGRNGEGDEQRHDQHAERHEPKAEAAVPSPKDIAAMPRHEEPTEAPSAGEKPVQAVQEAPAEAPEPPKVVTRTRGRRGANSAAKTAPAPETKASQESTESAASVATTPAPTQAAPAAQAATETPAADALAPAVVTRTRGRRGASTSVISTGTAAVVEVASSEAPTIPVAEVAPPKVVTRTRRGASRDVVHTRED
ncbi:Rne/Rng family ribonuclease [Nocardioides sp.]|uniref:Rne/Rng family ribonuclease n=1 Tax=Nocardioides sp. TaxID=35761 RepID=UPI00260849E2|nr:Rne/Rng family ribonuclease [Nocardioides sp.]